VASADPKTRASNQLQSGYAFNYSINPPTFTNFDREQLDRVLDFLQVRIVLVGSSSEGESDALGSRNNLIERLNDVLTPDGRLMLPQRTFDVFVRSEFSAFVIPRESVSGYEVCPILQQVCPLLADATTTAQSSLPNLTLCAERCLWRSATSAIAADKALVLPVTYDNTLVVRDSNGTRLSSVNAGGFLGVFGADGISETTLSITLDPDFRMIARVVASYVNLLTVLFLALCMVYPKFTSRSASQPR
jgi:hypothetical protein